MRAGGTGEGRSVRETGKPELYRQSARAGRLSSGCRGLSHVAGHWLSIAVANRTDLALARSLRDGRRATVAIRTLQLHDDEGLGWPCNPRPRLPAILARPA